MLPTQFIYNGRIKIAFLILWIGFYFPSVFCQTTSQFNALADLEFSKAGEKSHFYYNEIDQDQRGARFGFSQLNLIGKINFGSQWVFKGRFLLEREKGMELEKFHLPQLNLQWLSKERKHGFTVGNFVNPFGSFNQRQLSTDRSFIGLPLAYSYYVNISDKIGFAPNMGDVEKISIDDEIQWGGTNLYYGGYASGAMFSWNIKPGKVNWKTALVSGASNVQMPFAKPLQYGVISKLKTQPAYFWQQGFSVSHGTFFRESEVSESLSNLRNYSQTLVGTDFNFGHGFFEISGEVIGAFYKVPVYEVEGNDFTGADLDLNNLAVYMDIKYEPPILPGSYVVYRIDHLSFNKPDGLSGQSWDNNVLRHSFAIGYRVNQYLLIRAAASTQQVDNKEWDKTQRTFRMVATIHY